MNIEELRIRRAKLQQDIYNASSELINDFQKEAGVKITDVNIRLYDVDVIGAPSTSIVGEVSVDLDI